MKIRYLLSLLAVPAVLAALPSLPAKADEAPHFSLHQESRVPLVVIRFSQRNVYFEKALYNAVSKAVEIKPGVAFDVVHSPGMRTGSESAHASRVASELRKMGIGENRIHLYQGPASGERYEKVLVYVQ